MPKQGVEINFAKGLDQKTDPKQVQLGNFLSLVNSIFTKGGLLQKRNGFKMLPALPDNTSQFVTTFNGDLTAIGTDLKAFSGPTGQWVSRGNIQPVGLSVLPLVRNNTNQSQADTAVAANGLLCTVYTDQNPASLGAVLYKYMVSDSVTGQVIVTPTVIATADATYGTPRVFVLGNWFVVIFTTSTAGPYYLEYFAISTTNPLNVTAPATISTSYTPASTLSFDATLFNGSLYIAWAGLSGSGILAASLTPTLDLSATYPIDNSLGASATMITLAVDTTNTALWISYYYSSAIGGFSIAINPDFSIADPRKGMIGAITVLNIASAVSNGILTLFYEVSNVYSYDSGIPTNYIGARTVGIGHPRGPVTILERSVGLASKAFVISGTIYLLASFQSPYQPTYFLLNSAGSIVAKLAYGNGGGYLTRGLPSVTVIGTSAQVGYLFKDSVQAVNKGTALAAGTQVAGIYSQLGINLASFVIGGVIPSTAEIGENLNLTGGFLWGYDGYTPVENNFFVWPDSIEGAWSATGGAIVAKPDGSTNTSAYWYQVTYEWTDNQGNAFKSAPSVPIAITTTGSGDTGSITITGPTLRLTYKIANPVKIVIYRWSVAQQTYYQVTSIQTPLLNDPTVDSFTFTDTLADATILGNNILYTTGGVVEDVNGPAASSAFLFDDRLWLIPAENPNNPWFSKQVLPTTPVEMSDALTYFAAPTLSAQGSSGPILCGAPMDDKAILFKKDAISYINGTGPDNTGANNQYSQPILITSTVGCSNQRSIVFMPQGLMFQSDKGIWLLGRDLSTRYIGAEVEDFTQDATVLSAVSVPGTNEIRFTLSSGITLLYDYYYGQWGSFKGIPSISSTLFQGLHAYINSLGQVFQENPGSYLDGSNPVLIGFTTGWIKDAGLRGYERIHEFSFLGEYYSPHRLVVDVAFDYKPPLQQSIYSPPNFSPAYGADPLYGDGSPYGGPSSIENFRVFAKTQKCKAFQISVQEIYDPSFSVAAGQGISLSGINLVITVKNSWAPVSGRNSVG